MRRPSKWEQCCQFAQTTKHVAVVRLKHTRLAPLSRQVVFGNYDRPCHEVQRLMDAASLSCNQTLSQCREETDVLIGSIALCALIHEQDQCSIASLRIGHRACYQTCRQTRRHVFVSGFSLHVGVMA